MRIQEKMKRLSFGDNKRDVNTILNDVDVHWRLAYIKFKVI